MPIYAADMERIGLEKLLEYMDMSVEELKDFMIGEGCITIEQLAEVLSEETTICSYCGDNYAHIEDDGICEQCFQYFISHRDWQ